MKTSPAITNEKGTTFSSEDAQTCFGFHCENKPEYRVITIGKELEDGILKNGSVGVTLLCRDCMLDDLEGFEVSTAQLNEPIQPDETEKGQLDRQYGVLIVPVDLSAEDARALIKELTTYPITETTH